MMLREWRCGKREERTWGWSKLGGAESWGWEDQKRHWEELTEERRDGAGWEPKWRRGGWELQRHQGIAHGKEDQADVGGGCTESMRKSCVEQCRDKGHFGWTGKKALTWLKWRPEKMSGEHKRLLCEDDKELTTWSLAPNWAGFPWQRWWCSSHFALWESHKCWTFL